MSATELNKSKFWRLIDSSRAESDGDTEEQARILTDRLASLSPDEIIQFQRVCEEFMALSYSWDLRGAAHIINGGCSDSGFDGFRGWLLAQGKLVFENALSDPETLVDAAEADVRCPEILSAAGTAYKRSTGKNMPAQEPIEVEPGGEEWSEQDLPDLFPHLWAKFGEDEED